MLNTRTKGRKRQVRGEQLREAKTKWKELADNYSRALEQDHAREIEFQLDEMKRASANRQPCKLWQTIHKVSEKTKRSASKVQSSKTPGTAYEKPLLFEWENYFNDLLNTIDPEETKSPPTLIAESKIRIQPEQIHESISTAQFTLEETKAAVKPLTNNKSPGLDNLTTELLKNSGDYLLNVLRGICNSIISGCDPLAMEHKCHHTSTEKSRLFINGGISLLSTAAKVFNRLLLNRIRPAVNPILRKNQTGFRQGRGTIEQVNALRRLFDGATNKQIPLVVTFIDFRKALDSINREMLCNEQKRNQPWLYLQFGQVKSISCTTDQ